MSIDSQRRFLILTSVMSSALMGLSAEKASAQSTDGDFVTRQPVLPGQTETCTLSSALNALARDDDSYSETVQLLQAQINASLRDIEAGIVSGEYSADRTFEPALRYTDQLRVIAQQVLQNEWPIESTEIENTEQYALVMEALLKRVSALVTALRDDPTKLADDDIFQLFLGFTSINLLNAAAVRFGETVT